MGRPKGRNLSEAERLVYGDRCLALKLAGKSYRAIAGEVGLHYNSIGGLIREAARRRAQDRDLTEEINRGIAVQRQLVEDMMRDFRAVGSGTPHRANARARLASQIVKAQMNLLFLSGVEVPDPGQIITDALGAMGVPVPDLADLLSHPEVPTGTVRNPIPRVVSPTEEPPESYVIPEAGPSDADDDDFGIMFDGPGDVGDSYLD